MMFRQMVWTALIAGSIAGLLMTLFQFLQVIPLIEQAVGLEAGGEAIHTVGLHHDIEQNRTFFTALSNLLTGIGFGLLLGAGMVLHGVVSWKQGILWGLAGFVSFFVAPSLGLPPELPGSWKAALQERQIWWIATALGTAAGLVLLILTKATLLRLIGVFIILLPHLVGAPQPLLAGGTAPEHLKLDFWIATTLVSALFWMVLGGLSGLIHPYMKRF